VTRDHQSDRHRGARHGQLLEKPALGLVLGIALEIAPENLRGVEPRRWGVALGEKSELVSG
jgi:hypothetical protein